MTVTAPRALAAALMLVPVLASAQPAFQPPPPAFQTPSGNVQCVLGAGELRCRVLEHAYATPPDPPGCTGSWNGMLALRPEGQVRHPCGAPMTRNDGSFVLGYGARWLGPGITCDSEEAGLRCANQAGHGFRASRSRLELF
jgi:hypothetical protein